MSKNVSYAVVTAFVVTASAGVPAPDVAALVEAALVEAAGVETGVLDEDDEPPLPELEQPASAVSATTPMATRAERARPELPVSRDEMVMAVLLHGPAGRWGPAGASAAR
jgi:hypothetical protein